jgi:hypothetical protein
MFIFILVRQTPYSQTLWLIILMKFELTNKQREYLGLDPIPTTWDKEILKADTYRPDSIIYFDGNTLKRHIVSTDLNYKETQYNELTNDRKILLPKTGKGKEKKLTGSVLESRQPTGVYFTADKFGDIFIGNHTTQTTFYSSRWEKTKGEQVEIGINDSIDIFISESPDNHLKEIEEFKNGKRKNVKYKTGDFFAFKLSRTEFGFGRIQLNVDLLRKKNMIPKNHGLFNLMGPPLLVSIYALTSKTKQVDIDSLLRTPQLPSTFMMDNIVFYGELIGHRPMKDEEFSFPVSYGRRLDREPNVFLQWGLIHLEKSIKDFDKYLVAENLNLPKGNPSRQVNNPYGYYSIGFRPHYDLNDIRIAIENGGQFQFDKSPYYGSQFDLRNPNNDEIRTDILKTFGLNPKANYEDNRILTKTMRTTDLLKRLEKE